MQILELGFKNFLSYGNELQIYDLNNNLLNIFVGENGEGKSVITDALFFVLYGKPYRDINIGKLINRYNKKNLFVYIEFIKGKDKYRIERYLKPDKFVIIKNDKEEPTYKKLDQQKDFIENVLGFSEKIFRQLVILGSSYYKPFLRLDTKQKREIIEKLFDLEIFESMKNVSKSYKLKFETEITKLKTDVQIEETKIVTTESSIKKINEHNMILLKDRKEKINRLKDELHKIKESIEDKTIYKNELIKVVEKITEGNDLFNNIQQNISEVESKIEDEEKNIINQNIKTRDEIDKLNEIIFTLENDIFNRKNIIDKANKLNDINSIISFLKENDLSSKKFIDSYFVLIDNKNKTNYSIEKDIKELAYYNQNNVCSQCGTKLTGKHFDDIKEKLQIKINEQTKKLEDFTEKEKIFYDNFMKEIEIFVKKKKEINLRCSLELKNTEKNKKELEEQIINTNDNILMYKNKIIEFNTKLNKINDKMDILHNKKIELENKLNNIKLLEEREKSITDQLNEKDPPLHDTKELTDLISEYRTKIVELQNQLEIKNKGLSFTNIILKDILSDSGAKSYIIKKYIPVLNKLIQKNLELFDAEFTIKFTDTLDIQIFVQGQKEDYDSFSAGERQRIDLSILFTFMSFISTKTNISSNVIFIDEILDMSMDNNGIDAFFKILGTISNTGKSIFLISHKKEYQEFADVVYTVKKIKGFSEVIKNG